MMQVERCRRPSALHLSNVFPGVDGFNAFPTSPSSSSSSLSPCSGSCIEHRVSKMDTIAGVAIMYGVEVADIRMMNGLVTDLQMFAHKSLDILLSGSHLPSPVLSNGYVSMFVLNRLPMEHLLSWPVVNKLTGREGSREGVHSWPDYYDTLRTSSSFQMKNVNHQRQVLRVGLFGAGLDPRRWPSQIAPTRGSSSATSQMEDGQPIQMENIQATDCWVPCHQG